MKKISTSLPFFILCTWQTASIPFMHIYNPILSKLFYSTENDSNVSVNISVSISLQNEWL